MSGPVYGGGTRWGAPGCDGVAVAIGGEQRQAAGGGSAPAPPRCTPCASRNRSLCVADEVNAVVLDLGSQQTKAGYAGEDTPKYVFPSVSCDCCCAGPWQAGEGWRFGSRRGSAARLWMAQCRRQRWQRMRGVAVVSVPCLPGQHMHVGAAGQLPPLLATPSHSCVASCAAATAAAVGGRGGWRQHGRGRRQRRQAHAVCGHARVEPPARGHGGEGPGRCRDPVASMPDPSLSAASPAATMRAGDARRPAFRCATLHRSRPLSLHGSHVPHVCTYTPPGLPADCVSLPRGGH